MYPFKFALVISLILLLTACVPYTKDDSKKVFKDGVNMLYGEISRDDLFSEFPPWLDNYNHYQPDSTVITSLSKPHPEIQIEIFLGTWCSDSRREVPRFYKTVDESGFVTSNQIKLWAVDRNKSLDTDLAEQRGIESVSTFIFYKNETEIGRIIEMPDHENIEADILQIVEGN